jgi:hypothetical protein
VSAKLWKSSVFLVAGLVGADVYTLRFNFEGEGAGGGCLSFVFESCCMVQCGGAVGCAFGVVEIGFVLLKSGIGAIEVLSTEGVVMLVVIPAPRSAVPVHDIAPFNVTGIIGLVESCR